MIDDTTHRFCVAPMMDWTDRHDRVFLRLLSRHSRLYTEMVTSAALIRGGAHYLLDHQDVEHPLALQLGGCDPAELAQAAALGQQAGFGEVNLNVGCPSERVQSGAFGACLMAEPSLVADCIAAMSREVSIPVTVKCRIGIDDQDDESFLFRFIEQVASAGCSLFIIHARKAVLKGLSPKENRLIPPLNYQRVFDAKRRFPELRLVINGGITSLDQAGELLNRVDGVMLGREAYQNPYILSQVDRKFFACEQCPPARAEVLEAYLPYVKDQLGSGVALNHITRHLLGLFKGQRGGKAFRRYLSENSHHRNAGIDVLVNALKLVYPEFKVTAS